MRKNTKKTRQAFTMVELVVTTTFIVILATLAFYLYSGYLASSRDSQRKANIAELSSVLEIKKDDIGVLPYPWNAFELRNAFLAVAHQGKLEESLSSVGGIPVPVYPLVKLSYPYSITHNRQEYQVAGVLENDGRPKAYLFWNYTPVSKQILPSLILALESTGAVDVVVNRNKFIIDKGTNNLPYTFTDKNPYSKWGDILENLDNPNIAYRQNIDYESCDEIYKDGKSLGNGIYQIRNSEWSLIDTTCTFTWSTITNRVSCDGSLVANAQWNISNSFGSRPVTG